jgi:hypothetical protein
VQDEEHLTPLERNGRIEACVDERRIGERVRAAECLCRLPASIRLGTAGTLGDERLTVIVVLPARAVERGRIEVERLVA